MSTTAVYNKVQPNLRETNKNKPCNKGKVLGALVGLGTGSSYVTANIKDTLQIQNQKAILAAKAVGKDTAQYLKVAKRCVATSAATAIVLTTLLGTVVGAVADKIKNNKAQKTENQ